MITAPAGRIGSRAAARRPPGKLFLLLGAFCYGLNHLSVALGNGLVAEALLLGCWLVLVGGVSLMAPTAVVEVWDWAEMSGRRRVALVLLTIAFAFGLAEAVAWFAYGQHLWS